MPTRQDPMKKKLSTLNSQNPKPRPLLSSGSDDSSSDDSSSSDSDLDQPHITINPSSTAPLKRPQEETQTDDEQSKKLMSSFDFPWRKPPPKWGDEDLITLLKGLIEFKSAEYGKGPPYVDMYSFYDFIAEKLQVKVHRFRMNDKVRGLKRKFANLEKKGQDPVFTNPHDYLIFELSKKLWGDDYLVYEYSKKIYGGKVSGGSINRLVKNVNNERDQVNNNFTKLKEVEKEIVVKEVAANSEIDDEDQLNSQSKYPHLAATFNVMKKNMSLAGNDKMSENRI